MQKISEKETVMKGDLKQNPGISLLLKRYKKVFQIPENLNYYSEQDYKVAERMFMKYALTGHSIRIQQKT